MAAGYVDISLLGDERLIRSFGRVDFKIQKKVIRPGLRAAAKVVRSRAMQLVPTRTGNLRKGLKVKAGRRSRWRISVGVETPERYKLGLNDADRWYYPAHLELGHANAPAFPFMRDALDEGEIEARNAMIKAMRQKLAVLVRETRMAAGAV